MSTALPPDLRVLCRKLTSIPPSQLPHSLPSLIRHVIRCKEPLSASHDQKPRDNASESSTLIHKLKVTVNSLLTGRSREARFAAIALIKAMVDVGGWEVLRSSGPWVGGLIAIVQKSDPIASKELAVVTLTRIYSLLNPYQTLVREIVTPNLQAFVTACIQLIKPSTSEASTTTPTHIGTICEAISTLIPLYHTTLRPLSSQLRSAVKVYLAPTDLDAAFVPESVSRAARRLVISLHHVAAKSGGSEEWAKLVNGLVNELHSTADQVLRAVNESWESSAGQSRPKVELGGEPHGGGANPDELPSWSGVDAGVQRLVGLFNYLGECLRFPTKSAVVIPTTTLMDAVSRVCLIARLSPNTQTWDQSLQTNAAIGRDERECLWSLMPDVHIAALQLITILSQRLKDSMLPTIPEALDHLTRVLRSGISISSVRTAAYVVMKELLSLAGPTLTKPSVDMLDPIIGACCRDLQQHAGHLKPSDKQSASTDSKKNGVANADLFLQPKAADKEVVVYLDAEHEAAAVALLPIMISSIPQEHLKPTLRSLLERTAILTRSRDAMLAAVLNPYRDQRGRVYPSILPHLTQQYPLDPGVEILRSNIRTTTVQDGSVGFESDVDEEIEEQLNETYNDGGKDEDKAEPADIVKELTLPVKSTPATEVSNKNDNPFSLGKTETPPQPSPFGSTNEATLPPKRKHEDADPLPSKRQELDQPSESKETANTPAPVVSAAQDDDDDSDDESVHLNMELEDDEDDDAE